MPNYILVSKTFILFSLFTVTVLLSTTYTYGQETKKKSYSADIEALEKIAWNKTNEFAKDVKLTLLQKKKTKTWYLREIIKIDSLKYMSPDFFEDPMRSRAAIIAIKRNTEEQINALLTEEQKIALMITREHKRKQAIRRLEQHNQTHKTQ